MGHAKKFRERRAAVAVLIATLAAAAVLGHAYFESTLPPLSNRELAGRITGWNEYHPGTVNVSCTGVSTAGDSADHWCRVEFMSLWCIDPSTPAVDEIVVNVHGRGFSVVSRSTIGAGQCSVF